MFNFELLLERPMQVMWSQWETTWRNREVGKIILKNLDKSIDNLALYDTLSHCGRILSCKVRIWIAEYLCSTISVCVLAESDCKLCDDMLPCFSWRLWTTSLGPMAAVTFSLRLQRQRNWSLSISTANCSTTPKCKCKCQDFFNTVL